MSPRAQLTLAVLAAFLLGSTVGLLGGFALIHRAPLRDGPPWAGRMGPGMGGPGPRPMLRMMERRLDLSDAQAERFREILERQQGQLVAVRESTRRELERTLTPEQRERWRRVEHDFMRFPGAGRGRWRQAPPPDGAP